MHGYFNWSKETLEKKVVSKRLAKAVRRLGGEEEEEDEKTSPVKKEKKKGNGMKKPKADSGKVEAEVTAGGSGVGRVKEEGEERVKDEGEKIKINEEMRMKRETSLVSVIKSQASPQSVFSPQAQVCEKFILELDNFSAVIKLIIDNMKNHK